MSEPLREPYATPWDRLTAADLAFAEPDDGDEEEFSRAQDRPWKAAPAYAQREMPVPDVVHAPPETSRRGKRAYPEGQLQPWPEATGG
ncbi:hypothetical protein D7V97_08395 [Corallococcus sp. CA053C]|uniref:hypothetical protein n=1 Tax=Corallococcus sp. CA053C TaxID=2316732 RepID=UPI000EA23D90|nr:hypothetical protein [Corallococcus sp. CA053C]RKH12448.1 hypothetical protein D7V97_08395 [Corallococcus sp. CA053C]